MSHEPKNAGPKGAGDEPRKRRVLKAPAVRRAELIDCAQSLFLLKGYERTTIADVIAATGLSKGAFYHHFRAKEDLLEAIVARFSQQSLSHVSAILEDPSLDALQRLNRMLAMGREWKIEQIAPLRALFAAVLKPENAVLYHRVVNAVFLAVGPTLTKIIEQGVREGMFTVPDAETAADALLALSSARLRIVAPAMAAAESGDVEGAAQLAYRRVKAEEQIVDRILGLPPGSVELVGSLDYLRSLFMAWTGKPGAKGRARAGAEHALSERP